MTIETKQTLILNGAKLHAITTATSTAEVLMQALNQRERNREFIDINRFKMTLRRNGAKLVDKDLIAFWKDLEKEGMGSIIQGRNGKPTRFELHYSLKSIAKAGVDGTDEEASILKHKGPKPRQQRTTRGTTTILRKHVDNDTKLVQTLLREILVPVGNGRCVSIKLPNDVTANEIELISDALKQVS
jgi:hypothetical protein